MIRQRWIMACAGLMTTCLIIAQDTKQESAKQPPAQDRVVEMEKQIAEMQKKLAEMKAASAKTETAKQETALTLPVDYTKQFKWRSIGPANMSGRITAISVYEADPATYYVATASGGLLRTDNYGTTFKHQFDKETTISIGDVCVAPSDKNIVWVGTGEANPRNSVSYGDGVYKSTDGGETWKNMGLKDTYQIGKVIVHPKDPNIVYVGALGRCYGPNADRGVYKTTDGGTTWNKVFYLDDKTGVIDMQMDPSNPDTLIVAMWERKRDEFDSFIGGGAGEGYDSYDPAVKWGPNAGLYKTTDGFKTAPKKLNKGLPSSQYGRIGIDYFRKNSKVIYAVIDCQKIGMGKPPGEGVGLGDFGAFGQAGEGGVKLVAIRDERSAAKAGLLAEDIILEVEGKKVAEMEDITNIVLDKKVGDKLKVKYKRGNDTKDAEVTLMERQQRPPQGGGAATGTPPATQTTAPATYLGIQGQNAEDEGAKVTEVSKDSPADKAGLKTGDVIIALDGKDLIGYQALVIRLRDKKVGDKIKLKYKRGSETKEVEVTLVARPTNVAGTTTGTTAAGGDAPFGGPGGATRSRPYAAYYGGQRENIQDRQGPDGHEYGGIYKSSDGGESWTRVNSLNPRPMYFSLIRVDPSNENTIFVGGISIHWSQDGGKTFRTNVGRQIHADHHAMWIDSRDGRHIVVGCDGGIYVSRDQLKNCDHLNTMALGQFYHVATDNQVPYNVYGGLQDNGSWGGPSSVTRPGGSVNEDWMSIQGGDGFVCQVDQDDNNWVYAESQNGAMMRRNIKTGERGVARPRTQQGVTSFRFNWNTPYILSAKNQKVFYCAGQFVFRSLNRGDDLKIISPEITRTKRGSGTALSESRRNGDILWAGTDDGYVWVTKDGGKEWTNVTKSIGLPGDRWVATIEASRFVDGRAYVCFDAHRSNDDRPYIYVTEDFGATWKPIMANLPSFGSTRCLREDISNPDLLYCGTEFALFASIDRGLSWTKINNNLPTVAVHEVAVHPTAGEIVAATHGRSLWALDVGGLRQMKAATVKADAHLYQPHTVVRYRSEPSRGGTTRRYVGESAPVGAQIYFNLNKDAEKVSLKVVDAKGEVISELPRVPTAAGLHKVAWPLNRTGSASMFGGLGDALTGGGGGRRAQSGGQGSGGGNRGGAAATTAQGGTGGGAGGAAQAGGGRRGGQGQGQTAGSTTTANAAASQSTGTPVQGGGGPVGMGLTGPAFAGRVVPPGIYGVVLTVDGKEYKQTIQVIGDPNIPEVFRLTEEEEAEWELDQKEYKRKLEKN